MLRELWVGKKTMMIKFTIDLANIIQVHCDFCEREEDKDNILKYRNNGNRMKMIKIVHSFIHLGQ